MKYEAILVVLLSVLTFHVSTKFGIVGWHKYIFIGISGGAGVLIVGAFSKNIWIGIGSTALATIIWALAFGFLVTYG